MSSDNIFLKAGYYSKKKADKKILSDVAFGYYISKSLERDDSGQSVIVKNNSIIAVESFEGRQEVIKRGYDFAGKNAVIIISKKLSKSDENITPSINLSLIKYACELGYKSMAIEEGVAVEDLKNFQEYINENNFIFLVFKGDDILKYLKKTL